MDQEALHLANEDASMVRELDAFEAQLLHWGTRYETLSASLMYQFADLAVRERKYRPLVLRSMMRICI